MTDMAESFRTIKKDSKTVSVDQEKEAAKGKMEDFIRLS